jgi:hypothetical protein
MKQARKFDAVMLVILLAAIAYTFADGVIGRRRDVKGLCLGRDNRIEWVDADLWDNLIAWYPMERNHYPLTDYSDSCVDLYQDTAANTGNWSAVVGGSVDFEASGEQYTNAHAGLDVDALTVAAWIKVNTAKAVSRFYSSTDDGAGLPIWYACTWSDFKPTFTYYWSGTTGQWHGDSALDANWHHVTITYDRTSTANDPAMYIDGMTQSITENSTPSGSVDHSPLVYSTSYIGGTQRGETVGDVMLFDAVLSRETISNQLFNPIKDRYGITD